MCSVTALRWSVRGTEAGRSVLSADLTVLGKTGWTWRVLGHESAWVSRPQVEGFLSFGGASGLLCPLRENAGIFQRVWELERVGGMQKGPDVQAREPGDQVLGFGEKEGWERGCRGDIACPLGT